MKASDRSRNRVWVTLAVCVVVAVTSFLGRWQLGRAADKEALLASVSQKQSLAPMSWAEVNEVVQSEGWAEVFDRPVQITGEWLPDSTVFLDNRPMDGRSGFYAVSVFMPTHAKAGVLVQRGWVPRRFDDRQAVPELPMPAGELTLHGRLSSPPSRLYELGEEGTGRVRQNIDPSQHGAALGVTLVPASVVQLMPAFKGDDLLRHWPVVGSDVHKHYGYAFQWFGLGALTLGLYVWFQFFLPRRRRQSDIPTG